MKKGGHCMNDKLTREIIIRINDKIHKIEEALEHLEEVVPESFDEYVQDKNFRLMCERLFEIITESLVDLTFLIIKIKNLEIPEDDESSFFVLSQAGIISEALAERLKAAKGMRNIIAHEYGEIDDGKVFYSCKHEISKDAPEFIDNIHDVIDDVENTLEKNLEKKNE